MATELKQYKLAHFINRKQLVLMLVAGVLSSTANAVVNLNPKAAVPGGAEAILPGTVVLASEIEINTTEGTELVDRALDVTGKAGFVITAGETFYARIDLTGATIKTIGSSTISGFLTGADVGFAAGGDESDHIIISITSNNAITPDDDWVFQDVAYLIKDKNDVTISYSLFENASDALANRSSGILNNQSGTLVRFERASLITVGPADTARIDLASFSTKFVGGVLTTPVMKFTVGNAENVQGTIALPSTDTSVDTIFESVTLTVRGNVVAAATNEAGDEVTGVVLDGNGCSTADDASDTDKDFEVIGAVHELKIETVFDLDMNHYPFNDAEVCLTVDGETEIQPTTFTGYLAVTVNEGYVVIDQFTVPPEIVYPEVEPEIDDETGSGSTLLKTGSSKVLNFLLSPGGVFDNFVRLTNNSVIAGSDLQITLYNDDGDFVTFDLADVEGVDSNDLAPGASTRLLSIDELYAAAQAVDRGDEGMFEVTDEGRGKLRAKIEGSIVNNRLEVQALSQSRDNTAFFTF